MGISSAPPPAARAARNERLTLRDGITGQSVPVPARIGDAKEITLPLRLGPFQILVGWL